MRKLKRAMARVHMKEAKISHIHKRLYADSNSRKSRKVSFFSKHWREWINGKPQTKKRKRRKAIRKMNRLLEDM